MITRLISLMTLCLTLAQSGTQLYVDQTSLGGELYLVNRTYRLTQNYQPDDLVKPEVKALYSGITMRKEAAGHLEELFLAAQEEGFNLVAVSGYRSYARQGAIFNRKVKTTGSKSKAELLVAPAGASEHQLGLAMDVARRGSTNLNQQFGLSREGQWLSENAHRFGFIQRYKTEWTDITGYANEPWHIRYVGIKHAGAIFQMNIPLEEYTQCLAKIQFGEYLAEGGM